MPSLVFKDNQGSPITQPIERLPLTIGRISNNDIVIISGIVSRNHARIIKENERYYIEDLNSANGVFLNGIRIGKAPLKYGDEIKIGQTVLTFVETEIAQAITADSVIEEASKERLVEFEEYIKRLEELLNCITQHPEDTRNNIEAHQIIRRMNRNFRKLIKEAEIRHTLYDVSNLIASVFDMQVLLNLIMDLALKVIHAERGFVLMKDDETNILKVRVARLMDEDIKDFERVGISTSIAGNVLSEGEPLLTFDAATDPRFSMKESIISHNIKSVICVPLKNREGETYGVIYADNKCTNKKNRRVFTKDDLDFFVAFANQSSIAIENTRLYEKIRSEEQMRLNLSRYLSPQIVEKVIHEPGELQLGGIKKHVTLLFADIRNFTPTTEQVDSIVLVTLLNEYFTIMTQVIFDHEGTLDKYLGDGLMAVFGAPFAHPDDEIRAIKAAMKMQSLVENLKKGWSSRDVPDLFSKDFYIGIGISTGEVISGNIGSYSRMDYTVIGDTVNLASRLSGVAEKGQILISNDTYSFVHERVSARELEDIYIKGKENPVKVFEVLGLIPQRRN
jgi:adenylate cyclase